MAIDLPESLEPTRLEMRRPEQAATSELHFRGFRLHLYGIQPLPTDDLQALVEPAHDLSAAVRLLADLYVDAGFPAAQLHYLLVDKDLYVLTMRGTVNEIDAPEQLQPYFEPLIGRDPLRDRDLERRRILASLHADRIGQDYAAEFEPTGIETSALRLREVNGGPDPTQLSVGVSNTGNRFSGRYLVDVFADHSLASGDRFSAGWQTAPGAFNDEQRAERFDEFIAGWSRVHPLGVFGVQAELTRYAYRLRQPLLAINEADARIVQVEASWQYPLAAGFDHRIIANAQVDYTHKRAELDDGTRLQNEEYPSIELGVEGSWLTPLPKPQQLTLTAGLDLRQGLGSDGEPTAVNERQLRYLIGRPRLTAALVVDDRWELLLHGELQITRDTVPEQSQWVLGGVDYLEAWLPGIAVGDSGGLARLQLNYLETGGWFGIELIPGIFAEYGHARFERPYQDLRPAGTLELADVGAVIEMRHARGLRARASIARGIADNGIDREALDRDEANFYFSVSASF